MSTSDLAQILEGIRGAMCFARECYSHLEDERMATAVITVLRRDLLSDAEICGWIEGFADLALKVEASPEGHVIRANGKNFLQSLYFHLQWEGMAEWLETTIAQTLRRINPFAGQAET